MVFIFYLSKNMNPCLYILFLVDKSMAEVMNIRAMRKKLQK